MKRKTQREAYVLVETLSGGTLLRETFAAVTPEEAIERAESVLEGGEAELWTGKRLVRRWAGPSHFVVFRPEDNGCRYPGHLPPISTGGPRPEAATS